MELNKYLNAEPMTSIEYGACDKLVNFRKYSKYIVVIYIYPICHSFPEMSHKLYIFYFVSLFNTV
jgi:hypothetical protein